MPITGLSTFEDNEILTAGKLNTLVQALESKFSAITGDDIVWPLVCQGNIDFDNQHSIVGLRTFWNYINADEYDSLQLAIDAAEAAGGGCVVIPPDTTITADTVDIEASSIWIVGCGPSSVLKLTSGASGGYHIRTGSGTLTDIGLMNLTMNGQSVASQLGMVFRFIDGCTVKGVTFQNYAAAALKFTHAGTAGTQKCQNVMVSDCKFEDGAGTHLDIEDVDVGTFENIISTAATATAAIDAEPTSSAGFIKSLNFSNIRIIGTTGIGMLILGASATANDKWSLISLDQISITGTTGDAFNIGENAKILKNTSMRDCDAPDAGADAIVFNVEIGQLQDCSGYNAFDDGCDLLFSEKVMVTGCDFRSAGGIGIDATDTTSCSIFGNDVTDWTTEGIDTAGSTTIELGPNQGHLCSTLNTVIADNPADTRSSTGSYPTTYVIPADTLKVGDLIRITILFDVTGYTGGTIVFDTNVNGNSIGTTPAFSSVGEAHVIYELYVSALTGAANIRATMTSVSRAAATSDVTTATSNETIDLTADATISTEVTISDTANALFDSIIIELLGGNA